MPKYSFISSNDISYIPLVLQAFAIFCGMAIQNTVMYENVNKAMAKQKVALEVRIVHFTVVCLVAKPLNRNEAKGDLVMIQTLLLFKCKLLCYHANKILVSITTRSPSASL